MATAEAVMEAAVKRTRRPTQRINSETGSKENAKKSFIPSVSIHAKGRARISDANEENNIHRRQISSMLSHWTKMNKRQPNTPHHSIV
eukprot:g48760.t1